MGEDAPRIIARLPFIEREDHPAGLPVFVIARPSVAAAVRDIVPVPCGRPPRARPVPPLDALGGQSVGEAPGLRLVAVAGAHSETFADQVRALHGPLHPVEVGSHAARFSVTDSAPAVS